MHLSIHPYVTTAMQVSVSQARVGELEAALEESEDRRRKERSSASAGGGSGGTGGIPSSLRDSEDRVMREEKLKDDLERARRLRLDLEAALLDRDAR